MSAAFSGHPAVRVEPVGPPPAERYRVFYNLPGLMMSPDRRLVRAYSHVVDVTLPGGYPRQQPYCVPITPVFHPNISAHVCIADHWSPSQSLVDVVVQIGQMLQYQLYNVRSPLDAVAARWVGENLHQLPVGNVQVRPMEIDVALLPGSGAPA